MPLSRGLVRPPSRSLAEGLTTSGLGAPDVDLARKQHRGYVRALESCGLEVDVLPAADAYPDATFVEDTAVFVGSCAVITNPGAPSRRGETGLIRGVLEDAFPHVETVVPPGTLDGGDVLRVADHYFVGLTARTNPAGARQFIEIVKRSDGTGSVIRLDTMLHLKTGVSWLGDDRLLVAGELRDHDAFRRFRRVTVPAAEAYAANALHLNGTVLLPEGYPETGKRISRFGYPVHTVAMSEFQKMDGGLSCLSLRY